MKNSIGNAVTLSLFGESHGEALGFVLDGLPAGLNISTDYIAELLSLRQGEEDISTPRREKDNFKILSGVFEGKTCGTPICLVIENGDVKSGDYEKNRFLPRPSHADYPLYVRNGDFGDYRGGGHASGRLTAALVAAGGIILPFLRNKNIEIATKIDSIGGIFDTDFCGNSDSYYTRFPVSSLEKGDQMRELIKAAAKKGDSVGGTLKTAITGMPVGVGEPFFDTLEGLISHAVFSVPAVKGIEFGIGREFASQYGSAVNDEYDLENGKITLKTNNNGGILGGFSNGADILFTTVIKPTPTISLPQETVNLKENKKETVSFSGRHDPSIVPRAAIVQTAAAAFAVLDALVMRYGSEWLL